MSDQVFDAVVGQNVIEKTCREVAGAFKGVGKKLATIVIGHLLLMKIVGANHLTAFIDVQQKLLFYLVTAWEDDFTGYVIDYGCYPGKLRWGQTCSSVFVRVYGLYF